MTVNRETELYNNLEGLPNSYKVTALHQDADFVPPLYNVWTFAKKTNGVSHFGNSEQAIDALFQDLEALPNFEKVTVLHQ